jgi:adenylate cyclase class 2
MHLNFEFKAAARNLEEQEALLQGESPRFIGTDHQIDTYFTVPHGRLKLREGTIENALIHYQRSNLAGAKQSDVILYTHEPHPALKAALQAALGIKVVIDKKRRIYFVGNVKFHFDVVEGLGSFIEVEAIDEKGTIGIEKLREQCHYYQGLLQISDADFISHSYSDLLLEKKSSTTP